MKLWRSSLGPGEGNACGKEEASMVKPGALSPVQSNGAAFMATACVLVAAATVIALIAVD